MNGVQCLIHPDDIISFFGQQSNEAEAGLINIPNSFLV